MSRQIKSYMGSVLAISFFIVPPSALAKDNKPHPEADEACERVGKKHDSSGMLNMKTCKARCVDSKGKISFENIANKSECLCFEHNKFGDKGVCKSGKCVH